MKRIIYTLSILILFQSCYSYKTFDLNDSENLVQEKVKIELKGSRKFKGLITEFKENKLFVENNSEIIVIPFNQVKKIKNRKYSWWKTTILKSSIGFLVTFSGFFLILKKAWAN